MQEMITILFPTFVLGFVFIAASQYFTLWHEAAVNISADSICVLRHLRTATIQTTIACSFLACLMNLLHANIWNLKVK